MGNSLTGDMGNSYRSGICPGERKRRKIDLTRFRAVGAVHAALMIVSSAGLSAQAGRGCSCRINGASFAGVSSAACSGVVSGERRRIASAR